MYYFCFGHRRGAQVEELTCIVLGLMRAWDLSFAGDSLGETFINPVKQARTYRETTSPNRWNLQTKPKETCLYMRSPVPTCIQTPLKPTTASEVAFRKAQKQDPSCHPIVEKKEQPVGETGQTCGSFQKSGALI